MSRAREVRILWPSGGEALRERLVSLGFRALVLDPEELAAGLEDGSDAGVLVGTDLPVGDRDAILARLGPALASARTAAVAVGPQPAPEVLDRLRDAGFALSLFEPFDDATLRFQVNRIFLGRRDAGPGRCEARVPVDWPVVVHVGQRRKTASLYTLSSGGAFVETTRPSVRGVALRVEIPLCGRTRDLAATVVHTNVPGNLMHSHAPVGMGVRFAELPGPVIAELEGLVAERAAALVV